MVLSNSPGTQTRVVVTPVGVVVVVRLIVSGAVAVMAGLEVATGCILEAAAVAAEVVPLCSKYRSCSLLPPAAADGPPGPPGPPGPTLAPEIGAVGG